MLLARLTTVPPPVVLWPALVGLGLLLLLTAQPIGQPRPDLAAWLRRLDVDERLRSPAAGAPVRPLFASPVLEAFLRPVLDDLGRLIQLILANVGLAGGDELARQLALVRPGVGPAEFFGEKVASGIIGLALFPLMATLGIHPFGPWPPWTWVAAAVVGFLAPDWQLERRGEARQTAWLMELPAILELLTIACSAGLALEQALTMVARNNRGLVAGELQRAMREVALGQRTLAEALEAMGERNGVPELTASLNQLRASAEQGLPLTQGLAVQAEALRERKRLRIVAEGGKASVLMILPVALFILPPLFAVLLYPAVESFLNLAG